MSARPGQIGFREPRHGSHSENLKSDPAQKESRDHTKKAGRRTVPAVGRLKLGTEESRRGEDREWEADASGGSR
ncbi:UNVERIFIED_CONTAM: hypothetical protein Sangu_1651900 [Sesamum angustifolium]|uniref:Uncharacterized protein n=1 Tax=Sesamum angustifolium TaxID=2727405 RepID=A0AAW2MHS8_9LAMI